MQKISVVWQIAKANFRPGQVDEDGDRLVDLVAERANVVDVLLLRVGLGMGHVQPKHIDARGDQRGELLPFGAGGADGRDDLGSRERRGGEELGMSLRFVCSRLSIALILWPFVRRSGIVQFGNSASSCLDSGRADQRYFLRQP